MQPPSLEHPLRTVSADDARRELDAVLKSESFRRSERQSQFLRFICELTLAGDSTRINEYLLAHEVFGRGPDYSPGEDSVVRRQAHTLRQKLQDYYSAEGRNHEVRIEIPVGRYVPLFSYQSQPAEVVPEVVPAPTAPPAITPPVVRQPTPSLKMLLVAGCAALLLFIGGWLAGRAGRSTQVEGFANIPASITEIWGSWLHDPAGATICFSNPITAVVKQFDKPVPAEGLPHRIRMSADEEKLFREGIPDMPPGGYLYLSPAVTQAKMGEAVGSVGISSLLVRTGTPVRALQSRYLNWSEFRTQNLILLGHDEANRWLDPVLERLPLRLAATEGEKPRRVVNTAPQANEQAEYHIEYTGKNGEPTQDYALISMIRSLDGFHRLLLINGLNTEGTEMACEFLTKSASAGLLLSELKKRAPNHRGPWQFQAVIKTDVHDRVPVRGSVVVIRIL